MDEQKARFKVGDRVRVKKNIKPVEELYWSGLMDVNKGCEFIVQHVYVHSDGVRYKLEGDGGWSYVQDWLEKSKKDWDNLEVGDILVKKSQVYNNKDISVKVLAIVNDLVFCSKIDNFEMAYGSCELKSQIVAQGWAIKDSTTEVQEMTLADVCKELGRDIKIIKS